MAGVNAPTLADVMSAQQQVTPPAQTAFGGLVQRAGDAIRSGVTAVGNSATALGNAYQTSPLVSSVPLPNMGATWGVPTVAPVPADAAPAPMYTNALPPMTLGGVAISRQQLPLGQGAGYVPNPAANALPPMTLGGVAISRQQLPLGQGAGYVPNPGPSAFEPYHTRVQRHDYAPMQGDPTVEAAHVLPNGTPEQHAAYNAGASGAPMVPYNAKGPIRPDMTQGEADAVLRSMQPLVDPKTQLAANWMRNAAAIYNSKMADEKAKPGAVVNSEGKPMGERGIMEEYNTRLQGFAQANQQLNLGNALNVQ